jgi:tRNA A37 threonylcarbamoyladenosine synthetase subunit TsaC/SUA5/YrdC
MPVLVGSFEQMASLAISTAVYPYTAVLPARPKVDRLYTHNGTIAIRLVDGWLGALLEAIGPVTATSVNRSGEAALLEPEAIEARFADECRYMLWGKAGNKASKIVDHTGMTARVIRE